MKTLFNPRRSLQALGLAAGLALSSVAATAWADMFTDRGIRTVSPVFNVGLPGLTARNVATGTPQRRLILSHESALETTVLCPHPA